MSPHDLNSWNLVAGEYTCLEKLEETDLSRDIIVPWKAKWVATCMKN
jgi:hypothetical protein